MRKRPVLLLACMFLTGILQRSTGSPALYILAAAFVLYAMPWKERGMRRVLFAAGLPLFFILGMFTMDRALSQRERYLSDIYEGQQVLLSGKVWRIEEKTRCFYYYLTDCTIRLFDENVPCSYALAYVEEDTYSIGDSLVLYGTISFFDTAANEGGFDAKAYYESQKIDFALEVQSVKAVVKPWFKYPQFLWSLRKRLKAVFDETLEDDGVFAAMLLGERSGLDSDIKELYQKAGIAHILAISGLHISLFGMGLYKLLRKRTSQLFSSGATVFFVLSYGCMTGNAVSTRRAVIMLLLFLLSQVVGRGYDLLAALSLAGIILLWDNPFLIGNTAFLFSMTAVLGIGLSGNAFAALKDRRGGGLLISLAVQLFTVPLVAYFYYEIPIYAFFLNILVLALIGPILLLAAAGALVGLVSLSLAKVLLLPGVMVLNLYQWLCERVTSLPGAQLIVGKPAGVNMVFYYLILCTVLFAIWLLEDRPFIIRSAISASAALALGFTILFFPQARSFEVDVLDVGQGDGIYLCTDEGTSFFIDGGSSSVDEVGKYRILPFLKSRGIKSIAYWFVSHGDADHISGIEEVIESGYKIEHLAVAFAASEDEKISELISLAKEYGIEVVYLKEGDSLSTAGGRIDCLYPRAGDVSEDTNDLSLVLEFTGKDHSALFCGDIPEEVENLLLERALVNRVDFFKANHHGSKYSNSADFLSQISPLVTVASAGEDNFYGHPSPVAVERIVEQGSAFYCTADLGQIRWNGNIFCLEK